MYRVAGSLEARKLIASFSQFENYDIPEDAKCI
jgi:hypothetical protein